MSTPVNVNALLATPRFVRGLSGFVQGFTIFNPSAAAAYVQFLDTLITPTVGTTVPVWSVAVPTLATVSLNCEIFFRDGLWVAATTTDVGSGAPATALNVSLELN